MLRNFLLFLILFIFYPFNLNAEQKLHFDRLGPEDGLSNSSVSSIVQDSRGYLWFGTQGGLNRWDGYTFKVYDNDPYNTGTLSHNLVQTLYLENAADRLWVGTYRGLNVLDLRTEKIVRYLSDDADPASLSNNVVVSIYRDTEGHLWVGTLNGLNRLRPNETGFDHFLPAPDKPDNLTNQVIRAIVQDNAGRLWLGTGQGLELWNPNTQSFAHYLQKAGRTIMAIQPDPDGSLWLAAWGDGILHFHPTTSQVETFPLPDNRIYTLKPALGGHLLAGTWGGGLIVFDPQAGTSDVYRHDGKKPDSLAHDIAYSIFEDNTNLLWVGTNGNGISKYDPRKKDFSYLTNNPEVPHHLPFGKVSVLYEDRDRQLWIGVNNGGLSRLNDQTGEIQTWEARKNVAGSLSEATLNFVFEDSSRRLWIGTNEGLNLMDRPTGRFRVFTPLTSPEMALSDSIFYSMLEDEAGQLWIGTYRGGIDVYSKDLKPLRHYHHDPADPLSLSDNMIYKILKDRHGTIWVATNQGLNRLNSDQKTFTRYLNNPAQPTSLSSDTIRDLHEDQSGRLWVATMAGGLNQYVPESDSFRHFTQKDGLPNNSVLSILEDGHGRLFFGTQNGLAILEAGATSFYNLGLGDGLTAKEFTSGHVARANGSILMGSVQGVQDFNLARFEKNTHQPPVRITGFQVFNSDKALPQPLDFTPQIDLSYQENYFAITYSALDFSIPEKNHYAYKLEGFDQDWIQAGTRRYASYNNLPGGQYRFLVKGSNSDGIWNNQPTSLILNVTPPLWDTWLFRIVAVLIVVGLGMTLYFIRIRDARRLNQELEAKVKLRTQELEVANQELHKLNETKDKFFSIVAHDLKNPFTGMLGLAEYLTTDSASQEEMAAYTVEIHKALKNYYEMLENLLNWARLQTGNIYIRPQLMVLTLEVDRILNLLQPTAETKQIRLINEVAEVIFVQADQDMLASLLQNLVFNAIKFTRKSGQVTVSAVKNLTTGFAEITITDTGVGMPEETLKKLFHPEIKISTLGTDHEKGTGLGLMLCKELVNRMGGTISVTSQPQRGSSFTVTVPLGDLPD